MKSHAFAMAAAALALVFALGADAPTTAPATQAADADLKGLQGAWKVVRAVRNGVDVTDRLGYAEMVITGNTSTVVRAGEKHETDFELDTSKRPKVITFVTASDTRFSGIYELKGDTWTTLYDQAGLPKSLDGPGMLMVYERVKAK
jgi:uncharacterized protein (TIGR03067 family)